MAKIAKQERHIPKHEIHGTDDGDCIGKHVVPHHEVGACKVSEARRADLALVRSVASIPAKFEKIASTKRA